MISFGFTFVLAFWSLPTIDYGEFELTGTKTKSADLKSHKKSTLRWGCCYPCFNKIVQKNVPYGRITGHASTKKCSVGTNPEKRFEIC